MKGDNSTRLQRIFNNKAAVLLALVIGLSVAFAAPAAAQTTSTPTETATTASDTTRLDKEISVNGDTQSIYLNVTNTSSDALDYTVYGLSDGLSTEVDSGTISASSGDFSKQTFAVDSGEYSTYRIVVEEDMSDSDRETAENIEVGKLVEQQAGGGLFGGGGGLLNPMNLLIGALLVGILFLVGAFDPLRERIGEMGG